MTAMTASGPPSQSPGYDCVLIDDDAMIRAAWCLAARKAGRRLLTLGTTAAFWAHASPLDRSTPIYVDYSLGREPDGSSVWDHLVAAGYTNLYVETGYDANEIDLETRSLIKGVVGKTPPWTKGASLDVLTSNDKASRS